jgi:hypothetical protein
MKAISALLFPDSLSLPSCLPTPVTNRDTFISKCSLPLGHNFEEYLRKDVLGVEANYLMLNRKRKNKKNQPTVHMKPTLDH